MSHAGYIIPAYVVAVGGTLALLAQSWLAMRRSEQRSEELRQRRRAEQP